ncbi:hypothetical protein ACFFP0_24525 [Rhizobium puerariae]|uniref:Uncharacterized protein n=1 Tax=Rhizobium puerariae TaxID=1585791 RepID=A0ABV6AQ87_9HYPH
MADIDTSFYPRADSNSLIDKIGTAMQIRNTMEQNKLLQGQQQRQNIDIDQAKIDLAHKQYQGLANLVGSIAQDPRAGTTEGPALVRQYADNAVKQGFVTPEAAQTALATMPQDPAQIPQWLQTMNVTILEGANRFSQIYGSPTTISDNSRIIPATVSPITGVRQIGAPIDVTVSPESRADLVQTTDAQGRTVLVPKGNILTQAGVNPMTAQPSANNQLVAPPTSVERRALPPVQQPTNPPGGVVTSPSAGEIQAQTVMGQAGGEQYAQDVARERNYQADVLPLEKALAGLERLGPTGTGPGTETINEAKSFLTSMGIIAPDQDVKDFDEVRKYLVQYAREAGDTGTNDKLAAAFAGNPSLGISNAASIDVVKTAISLRRLQNAQTRAFQASGQTPAEYGKWSVEFNASQDPVAYGFDMMDGAQRLKYFKGLDQAGKAKFLNSLKTAQGLGIVSPPSVE